MTLAPYSTPRPIFVPPPARQPQPGDVMSGELSVDARVVERTTFRLQVQAGRPGLVMVPESGVRDARSAPSDDERAAGTGAFEVERTSWTLIRNDRRVTKDASTAVLAAPDPDPAGYVGGRHFESEKLTWTVRNAHDEVLTSVSWRVHGICAASSPNVAGTYLPLVYVHLGNVFAAPMYSVNGKVEVSGLTNVGSDGAPDPELDVVVTLETNDYVTTGKRAFKLRLRGSTGVVAA